MLKSFYFKICSNISYCYCGNYLNVGLSEELCLHYHNMDMSSGR